jgi:hypothetical protein
MLVLACVFLFVFVWVCVCVCGRVGGCVIIYFTCFNTVGVLLFTLLALIHPTPPNVKTLLLLWGVGG